MHVADLIQAGSEPVSWPGMISVWRILVQQQLMASNNLMCISPSKPGAWQILCHACHAQRRGLTCAMDFKCCRMKGGFVMPRRSMTDPSVGSTAIRLSNSCATLLPMSRPYAPVSSLDSQISLTYRASSMSSDLYCRTVQNMRPRRLIMQPHPKSDTRGACEH